MGVLGAELLVEEGHFLLVRPGPEDEFPGAGQARTTDHSATKEIGRFQIQVNICPINNHGTIGKGDKQGQPWLSMIVPLRIQVPSAVQGIGLPPEITLTDRAFLDLTPSGGIDNSKGKNRQQRSYREATGMNRAGEPFAWRMLQGKVIKVKIAHELYNDQIQERVSAILPG